MRVCTLKSNRIPTRRFLFSLAVYTVCMNNEIILLNTLHFHRMQSQTKRTQKKWLFVCGCKFRNENEREKTVFRILFICMCYCIFFCLIITHIHTWHCPSIEIFNKTKTTTYQFGIPPTNTSEFVANFPKWNSLPRDVRACETPSTVNVVCSSFRWTWIKYDKRKMRQEQ